MRGYIKATCCLLALSMLAGCGKNGPDKMNGVTFKLESKTGELRNNTAFIDAMTEDWNRFLSVVQTRYSGG